MSEEVKQEANVKVQTEEWAAQPEVKEEKQPETKKEEPLKKYTGYRLEEIK